MAQRQTEIQKELINVKDTLRQLLITQVSGVMFVKVQTGNEQHLSQRVHERSDNPINTLKLLYKSLKYVIESHLCELIYWATYDPNKANSILINCTNKDNVVESFILGVTLREARSRIFTLTVRTYIKDRTIKDDDNQNFIIFNLKHKD